MRKRDGLTARERRQFEELVRTFMEFDSREPSPHHQHPSVWRGGHRGDHPGLPPIDDHPDLRPRLGGPWTRWRRGRRLRH